MTDPRNDADFAQAAFSNLEPVETSASLRRRVAQIPIEQAQDSSWWPFGSLWLPLAGLAAIAMLGVFTGASLPNSRAPSSLASSLDTQPPAPLELAADGTADAEEELDELFTLALGGEWEEWEDAPLLDDENTAEDDE